MKRTLLIFVSGSLIIMIITAAIIWTGITREQRRSEDYAAGLAAEEACNWSQAATLWAELGNYKDSEQRRREARFRKMLAAGQAYYDEGHYTYVLDLLHGVPPTEELRVEMERLRDQALYKWAAGGLKAAEKAYRERKWSEAISGFKRAARHLEVATEINEAHQQHARAALTAALTRKVVICEICDKVMTGAKGLEESKTDQSLIIMKSSGLCSALCRKADRLKKDHPSWNKSDCYTIAGGKVRIGMTAEQAKIAWGRPRDINRTTSGFGVHEQWCYNGGYLYFESGILTTVQN